MMRFIRYAGVVCLLVMLSGCGSGTTKTGGATLPPPPPPPATPDLAVLEVSKGLSESRPQVIWYALPASYQKDVKEVITTFATTTDQDLYNSSFALLQKVVQVLQKKKDMILTHPQLKDAQIDTQKIAQNWDSVVNLFAAIVNSEASDLNKLKILDVEKFLASTGSEVMKSAQALSKLAPNEADQVDLKAKFGGVKATQLKTEGDTVIVKVETPGEATQEQRYIKVEGKWIPKEMATEWKQGIAKAKEELAKMGGKDQPNKQMVLSQIKMVDGVLDQMLAAKTADEFNASVQTGMMTVFGMIMSMQKENK